MMDICGLPCPQGRRQTPASFAIGIGIIVLIFCGIGSRRSTSSAARWRTSSSPPRCRCTSILHLAVAAARRPQRGNADLSYKYHFTTAPAHCGLGLSLILNGLFLAHHVNNEPVLTLPTSTCRYGGRDGDWRSLCTCVSFLRLLAGNLWQGRHRGDEPRSRSRRRVHLRSDLPRVRRPGRPLLRRVHPRRAERGGHDRVPAVAGLSSSPTPRRRRPSSIGFPTLNATDTAGYYMYPDDATAALYDGVDCANNPGAKCYNQQLWCPANGTECVTDNGAYPFAQRIFDNPDARPGVVHTLPQRHLWNWATIFILGFGNLAALDFQARCMAMLLLLDARCRMHPLGGCLTLIIGIPPSRTSAPSPGTTTARTVNTPSSRRTRAARFWTCPRARCGCSIPRRSSRCSPPSPRRSSAGGVCLGIVAVHVHLGRRHPRSARCSRTTSCATSRLLRGEAAHPGAHLHRALRVHRHAHRVLLPERAPAGATGYLLIVAFTLAPGGVHRASSRAST